MHTEEYIAGNISYYCIYTYTTHICTVICSFAKPVAARERKRWINSHQMHHVVHDSQFRQQGRRCTILGGVEVPRFPQSWSLDCAHSRSPHRRHADARLRATAIHRGRNDGVVVIAIGYRYRETAVVSEELG